MVTLYDLLDQPPPSAVREALDKAAAHFEEMSQREHELGHHERGEAMRDAAIYLRLQTEG